MSRLLRTCALATIMLAASVAARPLGVQRDARDAIEWPSEDFRPSRARSTRFATEAV